MLGNSDAGNFLVKSLYSSETGFKFISKPKYANRISLNMSYTRKNSSAANILRLNKVKNCVSSVEVGSFNGIKYLTYSLYSP